MIWLKSNFYLNSFLKIYKKFVNYIILKKNETNQLALIVEPVAIYHLAYLLNKDSSNQFKTLNDICVVDYPGKINRFEIIYNLTSIKYNFRLFLKSYTANYINSISSIFKSANWIERECWDMFGIFFLEHPDLRRILTDYGFEGFPLRKDFPLTGYIEVRYDDEKSSIVYEPIEMSQEYRLFNFSSPWEKIR